MLAAAFALVMGAPRSSAAQSRPWCSSASSTGTTGALTYTDYQSLRDDFRSYDAALARVIGERGWGGLAENASGRQGVEATRTELHELLSIVTARRSEGDPSLPILLRLRSLNASVEREIFPDEAGDPVLNRAWSAIDAHLRSRTGERLAEYNRRFFHKYGKGSERLNLVESMLSEAMFTCAPVGAPTLPNPLELIARVQVLGYQWEPTLTAFRPSSPTWQLGLTYYLFGTDRVSRVLHHVGIAGAVQQNLLTGQTLVGAVLHVNRFDVGVLCAHGERCRRPVFALSANAQVFQGVF
jgi:hypothetical protein